MMYVKNSVAVDLAIRARYKLVFDDTSSLTKQGMINDFWNSDAGGVLYTTHECYETQVTTSIHWMILCAHV